MKFLKKLFQRGKPGRSEAVPSKPVKRPAISPKSILLSPTAHLVEDEFLDYVVSYRVNDAFRPAKSHAGEVDLLCTYAPGEEYGREGDYPCVCLLDDDTVFSAIEEFRERGTFEGALEVEPLSGQFLFRAKTEYFGDLMYFYALAQEEGFFQQAGLCLIYSKLYRGTEDEKALMTVLDRAAESFKQEACREDG